MNEKLKPCPFCGGMEININKPTKPFGLTRLRCNGCGAFAAFQGKHMPDIPAECWGKPAKCPACGYTGYGGNADGEELDA